MKYGIKIGATAKATKAVSKCITEILTSDCGDEVKRKALSVLERATSIAHCTISNVSIQEIPNQAENITKKEDEL